MESAPSDEVQWRQLKVQAIALTPECDFPGCRNATVGRFASTTAEVLDFCRLHAPPVLKR